MGVTNTPNIALNKPDDTELAANWVNTPALQIDNNTKMRTNTTYTLTSYTPVIKGSTSDPNIGAGSIRGEYQNLQGFIMGSATVEFIDPSVAAGSGVYAISLPFPVDGSFHTVGSSFTTNPGANSVIGEGFIQDNSAVATSGVVALDVVTISGISYVRLITEFYTSPAKTSPFMTNTMPFTVATADCFSINFFYKKA